MGRAKHLKTIRKMAKQLPVAVMSKPLVEYISGYELIKKGITLINLDEQVDPKKKYKRTTLQATTVNHERQMKRLYDEGGHKKVVHYMLDAETKKTLENLLKDIDAAKSGNIETPKAEGEL